MAAAARQAGGTWVARLQAICVRQSGWRPPQRWDFHRLGVPIVPLRADRSPRWRAKVAARPASVGVPIRGVQKSALAVRAAATHHAATAQTIDHDGWLHTIDQARIDETNRYHITGGSGHPGAVQWRRSRRATWSRAIALDPLIEQVMVVGGVPT